jgi:tripartite-type tricarboxylate transporter receptor subunit TctC
MNMHRIRHSSAALALALLIGAAAPAAAQQYPAQNITFLVAFAAGGIADGIARIVAQNLGDRLHQKIVVENRGGAGGNIAAKLVTQAAPDGYTVLVTTTALALNDTIYKHKGYDTDELKTVAISASSPEALIVNSSNKAKTLKEFIDAAKDKGFNFGSAGIGTGSYIQAEYFFKAIAKINGVHVPFSGGAPAISAIAGNHVDLIAVTLPPAVPLINDGTLRAIGIASAKRVPSAPSAPTYAEGGYPNFYAASWVGFFLPAKTSDAIAEKLNTEINAIIQEPDVQAKLTKLGFDPIVKDQKAAADYFKSEIESWGKMARTVGVSVE